MQYNTTRCMHARFGPLTGIEVIGKGMLSQDTRRLTIRPTCNQHAVRIEQ